jgi:ABC-type phosphate transport system auxiliary subunit
MDAGAIAVLIPVFALAIPIAVIVMNGLQKLWRLRFEEARYRAGAGATPVLDELASQVAALRQELDEVQERLDFAERLLAQQKDQGRLPGPA